MNTDDASMRRQRIPEQSLEGGAGLSLTLANASCAVGIGQTTHGYRGKGRIKSLAVLVGNDPSRRAKRLLEPHVSPRCTVLLQRKPPESGAQFAVASVLRGRATAAWRVAYTG
jgi:hypothetical protein